MSADSHLNCPICHSMLVTPRIYENCGHTLCELCMLRTDMVAVEDSTPNTLPLFRCPICRTASFVSCQDRPVNHTVASMVESMPEYPERVKQVNAELDEIMDERADELAEYYRLPCRENEENTYTDQSLHRLCTVAKQVRKRKARALFQKVLPAIKNAAYKGQSRLYINSRSRELAEMASEIVPMLYPYGIYSVVASPREFVVNILKDDRVTWTGEYINPDYIEPLSPSRSNAHDE